MKKNWENKKQTGFSLIETIVYLALYAILIGGVVVSAYIMFESSGKNQTKAMVQEEGIYLLGKINWALIGATSVSVAPGGQLLSVYKGAIPNTNNPLTFEAYDQAIHLARGTSATQALNNTNTKVSNVVFTYTTESSDGITPESVAVTLTLTTLSPNGAPYSQTFSTTKYLRK